MEKFPVGTIHVAVVDPGVGSNRRNIFVVTQTQILIGPDNGLLIPAARSLGNFDVYEIKKDIFQSDFISNTFHGRDIFAPIAVKIIKGMSFEQLGNKISEFVDLDFGIGVAKSKSIEGHVIHIDNFGNIITNIQGNDLRKLFDYDRKINVFVGDKRHEILLVRTYAIAKKRQMLAIVGSSDFFEIAVNQGNAADKLNIKLGDKVKILFD